MMAPREDLFSGRPALFADVHEKRLSGAFGASAVVHVLAAVLAVVVSQMPRSQATYRPQVVPNVDMIFLADPGLGGGGGGGGNHSKTPPPKLELPKPEKLSVQVEKPPKLEEIKPEPPKPQPMDIPAQTIAAVLLPGTVEGPPAATDLGPGSRGGAGTGRGTGSGPGTGSGLGPGWGGNTGGGPYHPGSGVENPVPIFEKKPQYTADAMRAKVQGVVVLAAVVEADGSVGHVEVTHSLDRTFGLDQQAILAVKQWRFVPGTRLGQPVAVWVTIEMMFTLR